MSIFQDIASEIGLPTGALALAVGLVRGAKALETDANPRALKYVSDLLTKGDLKNIGKAGTSLVPFVFDKAFGSKPFSFRFISRSIVATTLFWLFLLLFRHASWEAQTKTFADGWKAALIFIPLWYCIDWSSLLKARYLINYILPNRALFSSLFFLVVDISLSYFIWILTSLVIVIIMVLFSQEPGVPVIDDIRNVIKNAVSFQPFTEYFYLPSESITISDVVVPSTMLTSVWTVLFFMSGLVAQLLVPIDYLRRFTSFWFKDVEHHPLTAIAKVAATLIIVGAVVIKAVRWIY